MDNFLKSPHLVNINGEILLPQNAKISVFDHGFLFGDSVYEVTRSYSQKIMLLDEHLERLNRSREQISLIDKKLSNDYIKNELFKTLDELYNRYKIENAYIRILITRGVGEIGIDPDLALSPNLILMVKEFRPYSKEWYENGVHLIISSIIRNNPKALHPNIKSGNYLNNILALIEAKKANVSDAILLNEKGIVTEATTSNVWMVKNETIFTTPVETGVLRGITRELLIQIIKKSKYKFVESEFNQNELKSADEVFLTSSLKEIVPVTKIDQTQIGTGKMGKITRELHAIYQREIPTNLYKR